jgi:hypothetical protein
MRTTTTAEKLNDVAGRTATFQHTGITRNQRMTISSDTAQVKEGRVEGASSPDFGADRGKP